MLLLLAWPGITQGNEKLSTFHHVTRQTDISGVAIVAASRESVFTDTCVACDTFGGFATFLTFSATGFMFCPFRLFTIFPVIHTPQTPELKPAEGCVVLTSVLGEADPLVVLEAVLHTLLLVLILLILLVLMVLHGLHLISTNSGDPTRKLNRMDPEFSPGTTESAYMRARMERGREGLCVRQFYAPTREFGWMAGCPSPFGENCCMGSHALSLERTEGGGKSF